MIGTLMATINELDPFEKDVLALIAFEGIWSVAAVAAWFGISELAAGDVLDELAELGLAVPNNDRSRFRGTAPNPHAPCVAFHW